MQQILFPFFHWKIALQCLHHPLSIAGTNCFRIQFSNTTQIEEKETTSYNNVTFDTGILIKFKIEWTCRTTVKWCVGPMYERTILQNWLDNTTVIWLADGSTFGDTLHYCRILYIQMPFLCSKMWLKFNFLLNLMFDLFFYSLNLFGHADCININVKSQRTNPISRSIFHHHTKTFIPDVHRNLCQTFRYWANIFE